MQDITELFNQHPILFKILVVVLFLLCILELIKAKLGAKRIPAAEAIRLINHENAICVDTRPPETFKTGHIAGALSIPFSDLEKKWEKLDKSKNHPIIIYCANGLDSSRTATFLKNKGIKAVILQNGVQGWRAADLPLVKL